MIMQDNKQNRMSVQEKEKKLELIESYLQSYSSVLFAFIHGSFLEDPFPFRDIDVAVYFDEGLAENEYLDLCLTFSVMLSALTHVPVDVHALNNSKNSFCYEVIRGRLLFTRDEEKSFDFVERTCMLYFDFQYLQNEILKDLLQK